MKIELIHQKAKTLSKSYLSLEVELLDVIGEVEKHRVYHHKGYPSLFQYCIQELGLSEGCSYNFINVSRKSQQVPELKQEIKAGRLSVSKAKKISSVVTPENKAIWIHHAKTLKNSELERQVAAQNPEAAAPERINFISAQRAKVQFGLDEKVVQKLKLAQDYVSRSRNKNVNLEETLDAVLDIYLTSRKSKNKKVLARDQFKCQSPGCSHTRYLQVHHIQPKSKGGSNQTENLMTLCQYHHQKVHGRWPGQRRG